MPAKRALISVYKKDGVVELAKGLASRGYEIVSTGGTADALAKASVKTLGVSEVTGFPEILDGRVKTLHPRIHGGILARRDDPRHMQALDEHGIAPRRRGGGEPLSVRGQGGEGRAVRGGGREHRHRRADHAARGGQELPRAWRWSWIPPTTRCCSSSSTATAASTPPRASTSRRRRSATPRATRRPSPATSRRSRRGDGGYAAAEAEERLPLPAEPLASRRCRTCATARTRTSARRSTATSARRCTRWPRRASCRARSSRSTTSSTSTRPGGWPSTSTTRPA